MPGIHPINADMFRTGGNTKSWPVEEPHPWYGPCDGFGKDGACAECALTIEILRDRWRDGLSAAAHSQAQAARIAELERALLYADDESWGDGIEKDHDPFDKTYTLIVDELALKARGKVRYGHCGFTAEQVAAARAALGGKEDQA